MKLYTVKPAFQNTLKGAVDLSCRFNIHPDVFTYGAIVASALAFAVIWAAGAFDPLFFVLVFPLCFLRIAFNALDGLVARARRLSDPAGKIKNEFGDRISDILVLSGLFLVPTANVCLTAAVLTLTLLASYLGVLGQERIYSGLMAKADRMLYLSVFLFIYAFARVDSLIFGLQVFMILGLLQTIFVRLQKLLSEGQPQ
ncbi:MAG: hypothetical protein PHG97_02620 [Candidatus Margulisbacteria bacterium]|nr:hypothetical protein [Candidatus Margulisiibacteriota bacterium]